MYSPVYAFMRNPSMVDYPGHLAAVFFVRGCNFSCGFCHNAELMGSRGTGMAWKKLEDACRRFVDDWVDAAVITGGEPTLATELPGLIRILRSFGLLVKLDTNGSTPEMLARCLPLVDYVAMDIKTGIDGYPALTGFNDGESLRTSIELIKTRAKDYEFRTTVIESIHNAEQIAAIVSIVEGAKRYALQPFVPTDTLPSAHYRNCGRTSAGFLTSMAAAFEGRVGELIVRGV